MPAATTSAALPAAAQFYNHPRSPHLHDPSFVHVLYDHTGHSFTQQIPSAAMFNYLAHSQPSISNSSHDHHHHRSPYPVTPPSPVPHKVWILDCRSCGTFLTNRGMKAVLLLRPHVSLYSSDALPVNCSAYTSNPDVLRSTASCRPPSISLPSPRTCECLTQTLCCHCCGTTVGYMIVIPCSRCTSSITTNNRATNGHRFVFHSSEVVGTERHYIPDEPGISPYEPLTSSTPPSTTIAPPLSPLFYPPPLAPALAYSSHLDYSISSESFSQRQSHPSSQPSSVGLLSVFPLTPPTEAANLSQNSGSPPPASDSYPFPFSSNHDSLDAQASPYAPRPVHLRHVRPDSPPFSVPSQSHYDIQHRPTSSTSSQSNTSSPAPLVFPSYPFGSPVEQKEPSPPRMLKAGDVLYWHHLTRNGEIPGVAEDKRSRNKSLAIAAGMKGVGRTSFDR